LVQAVERAARIVNAQPLVGREVHVLSDLQRTALASSHADVPGGVRCWRSLRARGTQSRNCRGHGLRGCRDHRVERLDAGSGGAPQPVPVTLRIGAGRRDRGEVTARGLATPGSDRAGGAIRSAVTVSLPAQSLASGWWLGEAALEPDELRADDQRPFAWRVAPPARVMATPGAGSFVAAALAVLQKAGASSKAETS